MIWFSLRPSTGTSTSSAVRAVSQRLVHRCILNQVTVCSSKHLEIALGQRELKIVVQKNPVAGTQLFFLRPRRLRLEHCV